MSSDGCNDLAFEYPAGAHADSPPAKLPVPIINIDTLQLLDPGAPISSPRPVTASSSASDTTTM
jgi:hypothetical protein